MASLLSVVKTVYIPALITYLLRSRLPPLKETTAFIQEYDYIVVGSGPGGSVVANRLSENPQIKVLLLEAGMTDNVTTEVPIISLCLFGDKYDWKYKSIPQKEACYEKIEQMALLTSGKVIGGSSSLNHMIHTRGNKIDFDEWSNNGNLGWSYEDVLPYFKKYENFSVNGTCLNDTYHGCNGELTISQLMPGVTNNISKNFVKELQKNGFNLVDPNGAEQLGVSYGHYTMKNGGRVSAATAFLRTVQQRENLHIILEAFVHKILIDPHKKSATGVEFEKDGKIYQIKAKKEVILSAGVYSSPKILMLSGIGPKEELEKFKIPLIVDLPGVGQNLQEPLSIILPTIADRDASQSAVNIINTKEINSWQNEKSSLLSTPGGLESYLFLKTKYEENNRPDLMLNLLSIPIYDFLAQYFRRGFNFNDQIWNKYFEPVLNKDMFIFIPIILRPNSKGTVTLKGSDPHDDPVIDPNYLSNKTDKKRFLESIRFVEQFLNGSLFAEEGYKLYPEKVDECSQHKLKSDEYYLCLIRYLATDFRSGCCTNRMGPNIDIMAVVDHRLRVKGIKGLRVVDASVFHSQVSGLPAAAVYMVSEKAAAMIKEDN